MPFMLILLFSITLLTGFFIISRTHVLPIIKIPIPKIGPKAFFSVFLIIYMFFTFNLIRQFGFNINWVSILDVYDVRESYVEKLAEDSGYGVRWLMYIFNPFLIAIGYLQKKRRWMLYLGFLGELMIYSTTGFKTALFIGLLIIFVLFFLDRFKSINQFPKFIAGGLVLMLVGVFIIDYLFFHNTIFLNDIFSSFTFRRNIVTPGYLSGQYFNYFWENPKIYMAGNKIISSVFGISNPYTERTAYIIGDYAFGRPGMAANANIWADAYSNFGFFGILIYSFILFIYLLVYDSLSAKIDKRLSVAILIGPIVFFSNSALLTALLGHGAIWALIIIYFYQYTARITYNVETNS